MIKKTFYIKLLVLLFASDLYAKQENIDDYYVSLDFYNSSLWSGDTYRPPKPIFWTANLNADYSFFVGIDKNFFSYKDYVKFFYGANLGVLGTNKKVVDQVYVLSMHLLSKFYLLHLAKFKLYLLYSPGGLSLLSNRKFATTKFSNNFVFENQIGFGFTTSLIKNTEFFAKIYHFSNGGLFPVNGGIDIPLVFGMSFPL
jgi:hypothetical protein